MRKTTLFGMAAIVLAGGLLVGCGTTTASNQYHLSVNSYGTEMRQTEISQAHLDKVQPAPMLQYSLERANLIRRLKLWNNPNRVSYIYLLSAMGQVMAFYAIKGKISSVNSHLSDPTQIVGDPQSNNNGSMPSLQVPSPSHDGSYGSNGNGIFFFTTSGIYVEWNGTYLLSTQPLNLTTQPILTMPVK